MCAWDRQSCLGPSRSRHEGANEIIRHPCAQPAARTAGWAPRTDACPPVRGGPLGTTGRPAPSTHASPPVAAISLRNIDAGICKHRRDRCEGFRARAAPSPAPARTRAVRQNSSSRVPGCVTVRSPLERNPLVRLFVRSPRSDGKQFTPACKRADGTLQEQETGEEEKTHGGAAAFGRRQVVAKDPGYKRRKESMRGLYPGSFTTTAARSAGTAMRLSFLFFSPSPVLLRRFRGIATDSAVTSTNVVDCRQRRWAFGPHFRLTLRARPLNWRDVVSFVSSSSWSGVGV
jgi:hypothetical protein